MSVRNAESFERQRRYVVELWRAAAAAARSDGHDDAAGKLEWILRSRGRTSGRSSASRVILGRPLYRSE